MSGYNIYCVDSMPFRGNNTMTLSTSKETAGLGAAAEPAWDVAFLFPAQGSWSEQEYLDLKGNRLVEFSHGSIEVLTTPTAAHQLIILFLCDVLRAFVRPAKLGKVLMAPFKMRLWEGKYREPDVMFMRTENASRTSSGLWDGADLVIEIVSDDDRGRDLETKRFEYARAGIPEYWIIDPQTRHMIVLKLDGQRYAVHGEFGGGDRASSLLLPGLEVSVTDLFAAGDAE